MSRPEVRSLPAEGIGCPRRRMGCREPITHEYTLGPEYRKEHCSSAPADRLIMGLMTNAQGTQLKAFSRRHASRVASWVATNSDLRWLSPSTPPPLTAEKVMGWQKPDCRSFLLMCDGDALPAGYGELNVMRRDRRHLWLGHVIVRPDLRRRGIGKQLVHALIRRAFEEHRARLITLIVFPDNQAAVRCYLSQGFTGAGEEYHRFAETSPRERMLRLEIHAPAVA